MGRLLLPARPRAVGLRPDPHRPPRPRGDPGHRVPPLQGGPRDARGRRGPARARLRPLLPRLPATDRAAVDRPGALVPQPAPRQPALPRRRRRGRPDPQLPRTPRSRGPLAPPPRGLSGHRRPEVGPQEGARAPRRGRPRDPVERRRGTPRRARLRARLGRDRGARRRDDEPPHRPLRGPLGRAPRGVPRPRPDDLARPRPLSARVVRPVGGPRPAGHRRAGRLHPRPGPRAGARDAGPAGGAGRRRRAADRRRHAPHPRGGVDRLRRAARADRRLPERRHPEGPVPRGRRQRRPPLPLPLQGLALPPPLLARGRARGRGGDGRAARPDPRELLRRQPRRGPDRDAPRRDARDDRPRPGEDEVPPLRPPLAGDGGGVRLLGPVHGRPLRDEQRRLHRDEHLPGDRRDQGGGRAVRELLFVHHARSLPRRERRRRLRPAVQHRLPRRGRGRLLPVHRR